MFIHLKQLILAFILMFLSIFIGMSGYMIIEGYNALDALYMTVVTISTVGFREVHPLSDEGKIFTSIYIVSNLVFFAFLVSTIAKYIFEGELNKIYNTIMKGREVSKLRGHIIVCGFGRNGRRAAQELKNSRKKFLIIENDEHVMERFPEAAKMYNFFMGDATQDKTLLDAGIRRATTIITTLPSDSENVFITLTARELNPDIKIISRASDERVEKKLLRAGATSALVARVVAHRWRRCRHALYRQDAGRNLHSDCPARRICARHGGASGQRQRQQFAPLGRAGAGQPAARNSALTGPVLR